MFNQGGEVCYHTLAQGQKLIEDTATRIAQTERDHGIDTTVEEALKELNFGLVQVVYEWARGMVNTQYITEG